MVLIGADDTFQHCLGVSKAKTIISTPDLAPFVKGDLTHYSFSFSSFNEMKPVSQATNQPIDHITEATVRQFSPSLVTPAQRSLFDIAVLVYTSGTTGKPKACAIRNFLLMVTSTPLTVDVENSSKYYPARIYSALPLFHGTCLFGGLSYSIGTGSTFCIRRKFSASQFWKDVHDSGATSVLYIGELCRYLLASPPSPYDRNHKCIFAYGNGLRADIWDKFRARFGVEEIREVYRATEGVAKFDNFNSGAWGHGCVGFAGALRQFLEDDVFIVRYDPETEAPWRDPKTGFCVRASAGEEGEAIGRVRNRNTLTEYLGNNGATEKKLLRDVFAKGDLFQRMGDLLVRDADGWIRFQDRVGDTFRWKGENVSAGEVRNHICKIDNVQDAVVYGVKLKS
jgi:acyl-CoA synthetase (AMP-forming)/AMP-acid ligase II